MMCHSNIFKMCLCRASEEVFHKTCHALHRASAESGVSRVKRADRAAMCQCHYARNDGDSTAACSRSRCCRSPSCCCGWGCAAYNADNNKCIKEINILFMFAPRCIRMHARPSVVCVCIQRVCGCEWEFVKQFLCSNFQSRHAPEIHCHLKHTMLHAAIHHPPLKPPFSFYFIIVHIGLLFTVAGNSLNVSVSSNHNTYIC